MKPTFLIAAIVLFVAVYCVNVSADEIDDLMPHIIQVESSGNPLAISEDGCIGLMQISPIVLKEFKQWWKQHDGGIVTLTLEDLYDEINNKMVGEWYLRRLKDHYLKDERVKIIGNPFQFHGICIVTDKATYKIMPPEHIKGVDYKLALILAAYNGGITRLRRLNYDISEMPRETQNYVRKILKLYKNR